MRIAKITVDGFKSLVDFELNLSKFTCLIGLNGSGKSTILQFIDFLSQLVRGNMEEWFEERGWEANEECSALSVDDHKIHFTVILQLDEKKSIEWKAIYDSGERKCTNETFLTTIVVSDTELVEQGLLGVESQNLTMTVNEDGGPARQSLGLAKITFRYQGSVLSQLKDEVLHPDLKLLTSFFRNTNSFDMLAPQSLRKKDRESGGSIGLSGQRLSAFLHEMGPVRQEVLGAKLKAVYPNLEGLFTGSLPSGWKELSIRERHGNKEFTTEARHVNDGMLRLIAFLAEIESEHEFLLFDEIENGINPELVGFLIDILTSARQQIMVTTHSPMILNYLNDDIARESVFYLHKTDEGKTKAIRFFDIPSLREKLAFMGPGEVFADTDLFELAKEISQIPKAK